jgi:subtilisin family serine protease
MPDAVVSRRYQVLVNGFAVSVPYARLPQLLDTRIATKVYPSYSYHLNLNRGPGVLGAPQFSALTGAHGDGVKVAVVDDGVDHEHPFLDPTGFSYPAGFPKGTGGSTTPKVIVARGFAGPGANSAPLDRDHSFHGTFVAGVIAGVKTDVAAGQTGFCSEANGGCHPAVKDVEGVAPRAYIGNYRVFNVPAPAPLGGCCSANSPEIVAAFEAAVRDGMDVINFSGGGPQADPRTDILIEAVRNVSRAGVVPVISAGNDRDFFGLGTAGSPATAPDAISVGAVANAHMFGASIQVVAPGGIGRIPFAPTDTVPPAWISTNQRLVDVGSISGVTRQLCDAAPGASLQGAIALVSRGGCPYSVKASRARAAGATGIVIAENRPGDPTFAFITALAGGTISDLDGARIRAAAAGAGGAVTVRFTRDVLEVPTTWAGVPTSFTSSGLTPFGHALKPDVTAPGAQVLSSTLPEFAGDPFAVLDGTSFSAPHVAGVAALLTQRHPTWTAAQMKSALMSTAGPAFADTALSQEASVLVEGAGLVRVGTADKPLLFTEPQSLSFGYLVAGAGANAKSIAVTVSDAGGGAGTWVADVQPQVASAGASVEAAPVSIAPGGTAVVQITARVGSGGVQGDNFGFVLLRRGSDVRRIPYAFSVSRSSLTGAPVAALKKLQSGDTRTGEDRARAYRWPTSPFSILGIFGVDPSVNDDGKEKLYSLNITKQAVNAGVVVVRPTTDLHASITALLSSNQPIHPWFMGSLDENDVLGYAGIPVNVNGQLPDFLYSIGAAGGVFLPPGRYYVSVDSGRDPFTGHSLAGRYTLRSWVNDVKPPTVRIITKALSSGRPTVVAKITDAKSGADPHSFQLFFGPTTRRSSVGATLFDAKTGIAAFSIPRTALSLAPGTQFMQIVASDYQEAKNINTESNSPFPNTRFAGLRAEAVPRPTVTWITPEKVRCLASRQKLLVVANDNVQISSVGFFDGRRQIGRVQKNIAGLYELNWRTSGRRKGLHVLTAVASDVRGREAEASQNVRICK